MRKLLCIRSDTWCRRQLITSTTHETRTLPRPSHPGEADDNFDSYASLLQRCAAVGSLEGLKSVHARMHRTGFPYLSLGNKLVDVYLKCGSLEGARRMFGEMRRPHIVSWNAMVASYVRCGRRWDAIEMYRRMPLEGVRPDDFTFSSILGAFAEWVCNSKGGEFMGTWLSQAWMRPIALVNMYAKFGSLREARMVYDAIVEKDVVLTTALIVGYKKKEEVEEDTTHETRTLPRPSHPGEADDNFDSYASLLRRCAAVGSLEGLKSVHARMHRTGFPYLSLGNKLVDAYLKCGSLDEARRMFGEMRRPHIVSWNAMVASYVRCGRRWDAIEMYRRMPLEGVRPDDFTFSSILGAFAEVGLQLEGRGVHGHLVIAGVDASNVFIGSALVNMYAKFGSLREARMVYDAIVKKDVVLTTALIVGYTQKGEDEAAILMFVEMVNSGIRANMFTLASVLIACANLTEMIMGMLIHSLVIKSGFDCGSSSQTSLLVMYSKCSLIDDSLKVFSQIVVPNLVARTAVMGVLVSSHREEAALSMFWSMLHDSMYPNAFTFSTALRACSSLALLDLGKELHSLAIKLGLDGNRFVGAALVDVYGKCGNVKMARSAFDNSVDQDLVSVNTMISAYAQNGYSGEAVKLFDAVQNSGLQPNDATFTSVLSACGNAGLLDEGRRIFSSIMRNHENGPSRDHISCFIDLLGRMGRLGEAEELLTVKVENPDVVLWRTLLSACKIHGEVEMAERAAKHILELNPGDDGTLILLTNIYASAGRWGDVVKMKKMMRGMQVKKDPAMSWVEVDRQVHTFMAGDQSHPRAREIYRELEELVEKTKQVGYVPDTRFVLQEFDNELDRQRSLYYHSEKLAVAFAVLSGNPLHGDAPIMILKNLRVCGDCHTWLKLVSKVLGKEITARDAKRFHHFRDEGRVMRDKPAGESENRERGRTGGGGKPDEGRRGKNSKQTMGGRRDDREKGRRG
ncbi:hypothetical protein Taro_015226 [Colocasia esculenta]|uniref:DYW domain-containing protein n=1 Tax=Colocasia esculenta TaxID=4460 RepID=A0A843UAY2_COLES|nr:hypothetical protein [Colocasia esculenta]